MPSLDESVTAIELVDPLIGTIFDKRFRIDERIAAGGFGAIYRATHVKSGHVIALKILHPTLASDLGVLARFRREGTTLTSLRNPHTITAYEFGQADKTLFIVLELLKGDTLFDRYSDDGPLEWKRMVRIAIQVCESLEEAHAQGIVHRDLKPTNIHLEEVDGDPDFVKVLDFGIAKILRGSDHDAQDITNAGQMIGTLDYMSPEQMVGGQVTGQTDIYTLGIVMYEMIAGTRPFPESETAGAALAAMLKTTPEHLYLRAPVPRELDAIVMRCLARETHKRYRTVGELRSDLERLLADGVTVATKTIEVPRYDEDTEDATTVTPPPEKVLDVLRAGTPLRSGKPSEHADTLKTPRRELEPPPRTPSAEVRTPRIDPTMPSSDARTPKFERTAPPPEWDEDEHERAPTTTRRPDDYDERPSASRSVAGRAAKPADRPSSPPPRSAIPPQPPLRPLESKHVSTPVPQIVVAPFSSTPRSHTPTGQVAPLAPNMQPLPPAPPPAMQPLPPTPPPAMQPLPPTPPSPMGPSYPPAHSPAHAPTPGPFAPLSPTPGPRPPTGFDMSSLAAREATIRRVVWIVVLVVASGLGFLIATQL